MPQERGATENVVKSVSRWVAGAAALLTGVSTHGLGVIVLAGLVIVLAVFGRGMIRWIIDSGERSDRVTRMITAWRGDAMSPAPGPPDASPPAASPQACQITRLDKEAAEQSPRESPTAR